MKREIAEKWVKALRSGEFKQGKYGLQSKDGKFCCLGVLCEVGVKEGIVKNLKETSFNWVLYGNYDSEYATAVLPDSVKKWAGMKSNEGRRRSGVSLIKMNDVDNVTFSQIADVIEQNVEEL